MTVAPELPPASVARRGAGAPDEVTPPRGPRRRPALRSVPAPRPAPARPAAVGRTVLERRQLRSGSTVLVERTVVDRPGAAPVVLEEVVEPAGPAGARWAATLDGAVGRHPAGRRRTGAPARPVGLVAVPEVTVPGVEVPGVTVPGVEVPEVEVPAGWDAGSWAGAGGEPGAGAGREHRPAAPGRRPAPRREGARVIRPATPRLRLSRRGRAALVLLWIAAAVVVLVVAAGRVQDLSGPAVPASAPTQVTVAPGETLWSIAERVAPSSDPRDVVTEIRRLNGLDTTDVRPGQTLLLRTP